MAHVNGLLRRWVTRLAIRRYLRQGGVEFADLPEFAGAWPVFKVEGTLRLGEAGIFRSFRLRSIFTVFANSSMEVGANAYINDGVNICAAERIVIGAFCKIADLVTIHDSDFHQLTPAEAPRKRPVLIGRNVWIGTGAIILPGAVIGDHAVIGAGAVVTGCIEAKSVAVGAPARVIRKFECRDDWVRR